MNSPQRQQWWIRMNGVAKGPFGAQQLRAAARKSQISADTPVRLGENGKWIRAGDVKGLSDALDAGGSLPAESTSATADGNPYKTPESPSEMTKTPPHWRVVNVTAIIMMVVGLLDLLGCIGGAFFFLTDSGSDVTLGGLLIPLSLGTASIVGAYGALQKKRWGVGLLGAATFVHSMFIMIFFIGDSFSKCWNSFREPSAERHE